MYWQNLSPEWQQAVTEQLVRLRAAQHQLHELQKKMDAACNSFAGIDNVDSDKFYKAHVTPGGQYPCLQDVIDALDRLVSPFDEENPTVVFADALGEVNQKLSALQGTLDFWQRKLSRPQSGYDLADNKLSIIEQYVEGLKPILEQLISPGNETYTPDMLLVTGSREQALQAALPLLSRWTVAEALGFIETTIRRTHDECLPELVTAGRGDFTSGYFPSRIGA
jgi:hypothetical protein